MQIDTAAEHARIISFLKKTWSEQGKERAVIAASGGIDSALALTLLVEALEREAVTVLLLPFAEQDMTDAIQLVDWLGLVAENRQIINIKVAVEAVAKDLNPDKYRLGNIMARVRMIYIYDWAKRLDALVCGTENKSEKYLGYFTRFGDEASDVEPLQHLYKTQVRALAAHLQIPQSIQKKAPSAGLWQGQSDESELGFSYEMADRVLAQLIDQRIPMSSINLPGLDQVVLKKILNQVNMAGYKFDVPYKLV